MHTRSRWTLWALLLVACGDDEAAAVEPSWCEGTLDDAATPLGFSSAQLFERWGRELDVLLERRDQGIVTESEQVRVRFALRDDDRDEAAQCWRLALPVTVTISGPSLDLMGYGTLSGTPDYALIEFRETTRPFAGSIHFKGDAEPWVFLDVALAHWSTRNAAP